MVKKKRSQNKSVVEGAGRPTQLVIEYVFQIQRAPANANFPLIFH